jgi:molybdopterin/thiamine biosynthesis adenylyltransferase
MEEEENITENPEILNQEFLSYPTSQENIEETSNSTDITTSLTLEEDSKNYKNSERLTLEEAHSRFRGVIWYEKIKEVSATICGLGGIGSWVAMLLARTGISRLVLVDDDTVETQNLSGQLYNLNFIGNYKVKAIEALLMTFSDYYQTTAFKVKVDNNYRFYSKIVIGCFDNMQARIDAFNAFLASPESEFFVDGRLALNELQIFAFSKEDSFYIEKYKKEFLFPQEEAEATVCSLKQTSATAAIIGGLITNIITNYVANEIPYTVPFITTYNSDLCYFNTQF